MGMLTTLLSTLNERRREMAVLRSIGAHPYHIVLLVFKTLFVVFAGCIVGAAFLYVVIPSTAAARRNLWYSRRNLPTRPIAMRSICDSNFTGINR